MKAEELWKLYCKECNVKEETHYEAWCFGGAPDNLGALVMLGIKTATASAYDLYQFDEEEPMPKAGDYSIILDSKDEALCVIQTTKTYHVPFKEVTKEQAYKEGVGDRSLEYWRDVHERFFEEVYQDYPIEFTEDSNILCEEFECVYSLYNVKELTREDKEEVETWEYLGEFAVYNNLRCEGEGFFSVRLKKELLGVFRLIKEEQCVKLGVAMKPELCGKKHGRMFGHMALAKCEELYGKIPVVLSVRSFNERAIKCYENLGFKKEEVYFEDRLVIPGEMILMKKE